MTSEQCTIKKQEYSHLLGKTYLQVDSNEKVQILRIECLEDEQKSKGGYGQMSGNTEYDIFCIVTKQGLPDSTIAVPLQTFLQQSYYREL